MVNPFALASGGPLVQKLTTSATTEILRTVANSNNFGDFGTTSLGAVYFVDLQWINQLVVSMKRQVYS